MNDLPGGCDLSEFGLRYCELADVSVIPGNHAAVLYRLACSDGRRFVLKWFAEECHASEVKAYGLLTRHGVPVLPVFGQTERAFMLPDLNASDTWRLAEDADMEDAAVGAAVARWYRRLHATGHELVLSAPHEVGFLGRESDVLQGESMRRAGESLGLDRNPAWQRASAHAEALRHAMRAFPETLNYNDFHWSNLALTRPRGESCQAIVFDYHLLGLGPRYSDYRNVLGSLRGEAARAFRDGYGPIDDREAVLDAPVSTMVALIAAAQRPAFPSWAQACLQAVEEGGFASDLDKAIALLR